MKEFEIGEENLEVCHNLKKNKIIEKFGELQEYADDFEKKKKGNELLVITVVIIGFRLEKKTEWYKE